MNPEYQIYLSKLPRCNQIWEEMTPCDNGRICQQCNNVIYDFRKMTNAEIARKHAFADGSVCGLYTKKQLRADHKEGNKVSKWKTFIIWVIGLFSTASISAQESVDTVKVVQTDSVDYPDPGYRFIERDTSLTENDSMLISGIVRDTFGNNLIGSTIQIKGTSLGTISDFYGKFFLDASAVFCDTSSITLVISSVGYSVKEIEVNLVESKRQGIEVVLEEGMVLISFGVVRLPLHKRIWYRIKSVFRKK